MTYLGSISGIGQVVLGDEVIGDAEYSIRVLKPQNMKQASGTIRADDGVIWKAFNSQKQGHAKLLLDDGGSLEFIVTGASVGAGVASIVVTGPIPGF